ncbi:MAG: NAD(P)/FAD-dependent oxidoreductase [Solirubrobacterales bacterium]|nr:NAD(P)/FAD-dependent oxidoreductase [Solirubrobacterales bacterium]
MELKDGERIAARRAVIAGVGPNALYGTLLSPGDVPEPLRRAARRYRYGPGTMMVHVALSGAPRWAAGEDLGEFAYIHIAPYVEDLAATYAQASDGYLPAEPMLVVGQTSAVDPSRAPGGHVLWVQVRALPASIRGDAAGEITARDWSDVAEPYADRVMAKLERYAPGLGGLVLKRRVLSPAELEQRNPNLVGGDSIAGSMHLNQNFLFRPFTGVSDYGTGVDGLLMLGAATWPGAGVNAISGYNVARKLLAPPGRRSEDAWLALSALRAAAGPVWKSVRRRR